MRLVPQVCARDHAAVSSKDTQSNNEWKKVAIAIGRLANWGMEKSFNSYRRLAVLHSFVFAFAFRIQV